MSYGSGITLLLHLINKNGTFKELKERGIEYDHFIAVNDKAAYKYCHAHFKKYGKLPSRPVFLTRFKAASTFVVPDEPTSFFCDNVKKAHLKHKFREACTTALDAVDTESIETVVSDTLGKMRNLNKVSSDTIEIRTLSENMDSTLAAAIARRTHSGKCSGASLGFELVDRVTDGAQPGDFITIAGRPSSCKTQILCNAANSEFDAGGRPLLCSFEMPLLSLGRRIASMRTNISSKDMKFGRVNTKHERVLRQEIDDLRFCEEAGKRMTLLKGGLRTGLDTIDAYINEIQPTSLFIDGAYLLRAHGQTKTHEHVLETAHGIKDLAFRYNIPAICTYQINRDGKGNKASIDNMMYSDAMAQLASIAFILKFTEEDELGTPSTWGASVRRILEIGKGREGEKLSAEVELNFGHRPFRVISVLSSSDLDGYDLSVDEGQTRLYKPVNFSDAS